MIPGMRFFKDGPLIPGELLLARDQGRVVFFCGAGVSYAKAKLPNFYDLAKKVCEALGIPASEPAHKLLANIQKIEQEIGAPSLISIDRVFGLLEREFDSLFIEKAVAEALRPAENPDLSAHRIMLNLATMPGNEIKIVTSNFDRLFSDCRETAKTWVFPELPDIASIS